MIFIMVTVGHNGSEEIIQAVQNIEQMSVQSEVEIGNLLDVTSQIRLPGFTYWLG